MPGRQSDAGAAVPLHDSASLLRLASRRLVGDTERERLESLTDRMALDALCDGFRADPFKLNFYGRKRAEQCVVDALVKRVRVDTYVSTFPEIGDRQFTAPILIVSPFRSGTTMLHRLLSQDPALRWPRSWEMFQPPPAEPARQAPSAYLDSDERIAITTRYERGIAKRHPTLAHLHPTDPHQAEECYALLESSLRSPSFMLQGVGEPYIDWLMAQGAAADAEAYGVYAAQLRMLEWQYGGERWLLKSPFHLPGLGALLQALPGATVVRLHRDPVDCLTSFCTLLRETARSIGEVGDATATIGRPALRFMSNALARAAFASENAAAVVDVAYDALRADPMSVVYGIYAAAGLSLSDAAATAMQAWLDQQAPRKSALAIATLDEFGLVAGEARDAFAPWTALAR